MVLVLDTIDTELLFTYFDKSGFTYTELAKNIGISRNTIHNILFGVTTPSHYVAAHLAEALDLSQEEFVTIFFPNIKRKESHKEIFAQKEY